MNKILKFHKLIEYKILKHKPTFYILLFAWKEVSWAYDDARKRTKICHAGLQQISTVHYSSKQTANMDSSMHFHYLFIILLLLL